MILEITKINPLGNVVAEFCYSLITIEPTNVKPK
jgi:hypothetical protein